MMDTEDKLYHIRCEKGDVEKAIQAALSAIRLLIKQEEESDEK